MKFNVRTTNLQKIHEKTPPWNLRKEKVNKMKTKTKQKRE